MMSNTVLVAGVTGMLGSRNTHHLLEDEGVDVVMSAQKDA